MLRPALLLPPMRLLTPRFDPSALALRLGPATGRSGAYPDGTHTRWLVAAFRTRHGPILGLPLGGVNPRCGVPGHRMRVGPENLPARPRGTRLCTTRIVSRGGGDP